MKTGAGILTEGVDKQIYVSRLLLSVGLFIVRPISNFFLSVVANSNLFREKKMMFSLNAAAGRYAILET